MRRPEAIEFYPYELGRARKAPQDFNRDGIFSYMRGFRAGLGADFGLVLPAYRMPFDDRSYDAFLLGAAGLSLNTEGQPNNAYKTRHAVGLQTLLLNLGYSHFEAASRASKPTELLLKRYRYEQADLREVQEKSGSVELVLPVTRTILPVGLAY